MSIKLYTSAERAKAMHAALQRLGAFLDGLNSCTCRPPLPARSYLGVWSCAYCGDSIEATGNISS